MSHLPTRILFASALLMSTSALAETALDQSHQKDLGLTIYQNGLGFVRDLREVSLNKGAQSIAFEDVSAQLIPDSLLIAGNNFSIKERRFAFDLLTPSVLLEKSVGETVSFRRFNSVTGKDEVIKAKILSNQGSLIIERDGKIEVGQPGNLVLDQLPKGLRAKPSLMADIDVAKKGNLDLALGYLTNGLKWHTSYSVEVAGDGKTLAVRSWANLTNTSGVDYKNATLNLAAGNINRRSRPTPQMMMAKSAPRAMAMMDSVAESTASAPQSLGGIHLYQLPGKVDLPQKETKQVALIKPLSFKSKRVLVKRYGPVYNAFPHNTDTPSHPQIELSFTNTSGQPLPSGLARLYRKDNQGNLQFIGEDNLKRAPKDTKAKLHPGQSFDVTIKRTQTEFDRDGKYKFTAAYKVVVKNAKKTKETVRIEESFPGEWNLEKASDKLKEQQGQRAVWQFEVPANGEKFLTYRVSVKTR
ncbi:DUF4139 domain-containing protein [Terasakiella sp. A23]|uniref:DUF4139 domain-containing protein n=1 Tax=Terasakiella sp. FCG-A23 TaxID=3080561 RepID=UPI002954F983|nr:DUF4139 domain-containing protein [Terasakiella sp. A23]MDV7340517.1 DUF4139 domain-containing protein [Terasakiella sp. A23]